MTALATLAWPDAEQRRDALLAVPLGATEQHGPHLPLCTDTDLAAALCRCLARRRDVVVAPAVPYGASGEHAGFAGTLSIGQDALELLLVELGRSATDTFGRVLLVNGHGGNVEPVRRAVTRLRAEGRDVLAFFPQWDGDAHAGRVETSLQLALRPDHVRLGRVEAGAVAPLTTLLPAMRAGGVRAVSPNGVLGDPRGASAAEGSRLLGELANQLVDAVDRWIVERPA